MSAIGTVLVSLIILVMILWLFYRVVFLRNPVRMIPSGDSIVSPADGVISVIARSDMKELSIPKGRLGRIKTMASDVGKEFILVLIVMNVWHVHYQRAPVSGRIIRTEHVKGRFRNAVIGDKTKCLFENEKQEYLIDTRKFKVKVIQIAGVVARRIVPFVKEKEKVIKGQTIGLIRLGSQVALIMPKDIKLRVKEGEPVQAGATIIGEY